MRKESPIIFSTPMVQAIMEGRKTMTRRTEGLDFINESFSDWEYLGVDHLGHLMRNHYGATNAVKCPYGKPGDILWVRESWASINHPELNIRFKADHKNPKDVSWKPSIHMPKAAARIWLEVTDIKVERLQDISPHDAGEEGVNYWNVDWEAFEGGELVADYENYMWRDDPSYEDYHFPTYGNPVDSFRSLWQKINGEESWNQNPWVWVVSFKVLSTNGKPIE